MTLHLGQTVLFNDLTPARVVSLSNIVGTYYNGPNNNGVGALLTLAVTSLTVDGVLLKPGDRILLAGQTLPAQNGIYIYQDYGFPNVSYPFPQPPQVVVLQRAFDQQSLEQLKAGQFVVIGAGTANAGALYSLVEPLPQNIGADAFIYVASSPIVSSTALTAAQFNGMFAAPVALVPAPGANRLIVLDRMELVQTYGTAAFAGGGVVAAQYGATVNGAGPAASNTEAAADFFVTASNTYLFNGAIGAKPFATTVNQGLYLSNATGAFTTGDSTFVAKVHYHVIATA
jgi:hypothetical protein